MINTLGEYWVTFDFLESEAGDIEDATASYDERVGGVVTQVPSEGTAMVVFQIEAPSPEDAYRDAESLYASLRANAGLADTAALGGTVTMLREPGTPPAAEPSYAPPPRYRELLNEAKALNGAGYHAYAMVAAQTACEVAIKAALLRRLAMHSDTLFSSVARFLARGWAMTDDRVVDLWVTLTGDDPRQRAWWPTYKEHIVRRNAIVHEGSTVTKDQSGASIAMAEEVCAYTVEDF